MTIQASAMAHIEQEEADDKKLGFWLYLMSDAIIFSLLFISYVVLSKSFAGGPTSQDLFSVNRAAIETALLLFSSITFGMASVSAEKKQKSHILLWLCITILLGLGFLYFEFSEFADMLSKGAGPSRSAFLSGFFSLVGMHGLHVSVGMIWILIMMVQIFTRDLTTPLLSRFARLGVFWHFLDVIWIGIFSVVYLPGVLS